MSEQITNLPWLLEHVARKLDEIAARLRSEEAAGRPTPLTSRAVKEALLQAVAESGAKGEEAEELVRKLLREL